MQRRILLVGDFCIPTGFARVNENVIGRLDDRWEFAILAINATGDPHEWPYRVYPAHLGGDPFGYGRFVKILELEKPALVVIHSDPWIVANFVNIAHEALEKKKLDSLPPIVAYMPVDAPAMRRASALMLNKIALSLFYTNFAVEEARAAGFTGLAGAIPLGIDPEVYHPVNRAVARLDRKLPADAFIIGNVNRNQSRKRLDLSVAYFAKWVKDYRHPDAILYLHCAPDEPLGWNIGHLARYYGVREQVYVPQKMTPRDAIDESRMRYVYGSLDVQMSTTLGEGFGLTTMEGMGCGIPQIVPEWSALAEWARGAVRYVPVTSTLAHIGHESNCIGGVPDETAFIEALEDMHRSEALRNQLGQKGYERSQSPAYRWESIAAQFDAAFRDVLGLKHVQAA